MYSTCFEPEGYLQEEGCTYRYGPVLPLEILSWVGCPQDG